MYKTISNICIVVALGLLVFTVARPTQANQVISQVLESLQQKETTTQLLPVTMSNTVQPLVPSSTTSYLRTIKPANLSITEHSDTSAVALSTNNIIDATNSERIKAGLLPLKLNVELVASAKLKTDDMIAKQYFEHVSPSGESVSNLAQRVGYEYVVLGENLALGNFIDGNDVVQAWINSPGHRANILNPNYQEIGVYAAKAKYQGKEVWFAVQHFGTIRGACPAISLALKASIDSINADLKQRQSQIANEKALLEASNRPEGDEYKTKVTEFNGLVADYNTMLVISQEKIKLYNAQVAAFNACLTLYQKKP